MSCYSQYKSLITIFNRQRYWMGGIFYVNLFIDFRLSYPDVVDECPARFQILQGVHQFYEWFV